MVCVLSPLQVLPAVDIDTLSSITSKPDDQMVCNHCNNSLEIFLTFSVQMMPINVFNIFFTTQILIIMFKDSGGDTK